MILPPPQCWAIDHINETEPNGLISNNIADNSLSFGQYRYVEALGFYMITGTSLPLGFEIIVNELDGSSTLFSHIPSGANSTYFGFWSDVGISNILLRDHPDDSGAGNWTYDNVSRSLVQSTVPIPSTLYLFGAGLLGLVRISRKKKTI